MKLNAYRFVCCLLCISIFVSLSLFSFADSVEIPVDSFEVNGKAYSYISGITSNVSNLSQDRIYSIASNSPSALGYGGISFLINDTSILARGANYFLQFVVAIPQGSINFLEGSSIGQISSMNQITDLVIGSNCSITSNFDRSTYPNPFSDSSLNYSSEAYLVSVSIDTEFVEDFLGVSFEFDIASKNWNDFSIGYSYLSLSTSSTDFVNTILLNIQNLLNSLYNKVSSGFSSVTTSLSSFRNSVSSSLSSLQLDMNSGFAELADKLDNINQSISDGFKNDLDQAAGDLNDANDKIDIESGVIDSDKFEVDSELDDLFEKIENDSAVQDQFLLDFNLDGVSEVTGFIFDAFNEYVAGIQWVGAFFGLVLTFEPFAYLMYVIVFINLLLLLLNNSSIGLGRAIRGERSNEAAIQRAELRGIERERKRAFAEEKRDNRRAMFEHYGF